MIVVNLKGGMGNQMFQYAAGYALAKKLGCELKIDERYLLERELKPSPGYTIRRYDLDVFGIPKKQATAAELKEFGLANGSWKYRALKTLMLSKFSSKYQYEQKFGASIKTPTGAVGYLDGYWQSEDYFADCKEDIKKLFCISGSENPEVNELADTLPNDAVCVNVRRGDFVGSSNHDVVGLDYYMKAIEKLRADTGNNRKFYVFSDDPMWCKGNFGFFDNFEVVEHSFAGEKFRDYFYLMTQFKNYIIPNSTFAWWAAWLAPSKNIVIAPKKWLGAQNVSCERVIPTDWAML